MINFSNFHCHSSYSDGKGTPEDIIKKAIEFEMPSIGISEHCPVPFKTAWNLKAEKVDEYINLIADLKRSYANKIEVYCGMEVDYIEAMQNEILKNSKIEKLDFIIGSIHFLGFLNNQVWNIDGTSELFRQGMEEIYKNDGKKLVVEYYRNVIHMVRELNPAIIGHLDKIRLHNTGDIYFSEESEHYRNSALEALDVIKNTNCLVEVNTRGLYKHLNKEPYPSLWMLKQMKKRGIKIVLSSDSHVPEDLLRNFREAIDFVKEAGYKTHWQLENGKWKEKELI